MKDQLVIVLEALRLAKAELMTHDMRRVKNAPRTVKRLKEILFDERVTQALHTLGQDDEAPSVVPSEEDRTGEREVSSRATSGGFKAE